jgi:hypothetical protein
MCAAFCRPVLAAYGACFVSLLLRTQMDILARFQFLRRSDTVLRHCSRYRLLFHLTLSLSLALYVVGGSSAGVSIVYRPSCGASACPRYRHRTCRSATACIVRLCLYLFLSHCSLIPYLSSSLTLVAHTVLFSLGSCHSRMSLRFSLDCAPLLKPVLPEALPVTCSGHLPNTRHDSSLGSLSLPTSIIHSTSCSYLGRRRQQCGCVIPQTALACPGWSTRSTLTCTAATTVVS